MTSCFEDLKSQLSVKCTWVSLEKELSSTISLGIYSDKVEDDEINQLVQLETCLQLTKPESNENELCTLQISCFNTQYKIRRITVITEARFLEIYGLHGEYIRTVKGENIDDVEGTLVNLVHSEINPTKEISLKFAGLKARAQKMWLYGVKLFVEEGGFSSQKWGWFGGKVDYCNVEERLRAAKVPITEKAERCKKFLQEYTSITNSCTNNAGVGCGGPDPNVILKLLEEDCSFHLRPLNAASKSVSQYLSSFLPRGHHHKHHSFRRNVSSESATVPPSTQETESTFDMDELKRYVDLSINRLEVKLTHHLDTCLKQIEEKQNEKLETILTSLKNV